MRRMRALAVGLMIFGFTPFLDSASALCRDCTNCVPGGQCTPVASGHCNCTQDASGCISWGACIGPV